MKSYKGILLLTVSIVLTVYVWLATGMTNFVTPGLALTTLSWTFMLATRSRLLEKLFNGIERMYAIHKFLAILSVGQLGNLGIHTFLVKVSNTRLGIGFIGWFT